MKEHAVCGPTVPLIQEQLPSYVLNKLKSNTPADVLLVSADFDEECTAKEIILKSVKLAIVLSKYLKKGDVIAAICENDNLVIYPLLASIFLGTTIAFINPVYNTRELRHSLLNMNPKFIFCSPNAVTNVMQIKDELLSVKEIILMQRESSTSLQILNDFINNNSHDVDVDSFKPVTVENINDTAVILSSSGTSGAPKGVNITYGNLIALVPLVTDKSGLAIQLGDTVLVLAPIFHIFGLFMMLYSVISGAKVLFIKRFKPDLFLSSLEKYKVTKLPLVPPLAIFLAKNPLVLKYNLSSVKDIICGAAPLSHNVVDMVFQRLKLRIRQLYGLTETGLTTCTPADVMPKPNSSGRVMPNVQIAIKDIETREILLPNKRGEICVKGPTVANGYFCNEKATKEAFDSEGYFLTGDVGYFDDDGNLFIVDRIKELIKYKGFQVAPAELEGILLKHESVKDVAVIGMPDENCGELPTAFVVRRPSVIVTEEMLAKFVAAQVSTYKQLSGGVVFVDEIPKNPGGKILKRELKERLTKT